MSECTCLPVHVCAGAPLWSKHFVLHPSLPFWWHASVYLESSEITVCVLVFCLCVNVCVPWNCMHVRAWLHACVWIHLFVCLLLTNAFLWVNARVCRCTCVFRYVDMSFFMLPLIGSSCFSDAKALCRIDIAKQSPCSVCTDATVLHDIWLDSWHTGISASSTKKSS